MRPDVHLVIAARSHRCGSWTAIISDHGQPVVCGIGAHRPGPPPPCPGQPLSLYWCECLPVPLAYPRPDDLCPHLAVLALTPCAPYQPQP